MFLEIKDFLNPEEVARLRELSQRVQFVDGRISNPHNKAKNNLQAKETDPHYAESSHLVGTAFARCLPFRDFALPRHIAPPLLAGCQCTVSSIFFASSKSLSVIPFAAWFCSRTSTHAYEAVMSG